VFHRDIKAVTGLVPLHPLFFIIAINQRIIRVLIQNRPTVCHWQCACGGSSRGVNGAGCEPILGKAAERQLNTRPCTRDVGSRATGFPLNAFLVFISRVRNPFRSSIGLSTIANYFSFAVRPNLLSLPVASSTTVYHPGNYSVYQCLAVELDVISREQSRLASIFSHPPVCVREFLKQILI
jgi:hypothetical protein